MKLLPDQYFWSNCTLKLFKYVGTRLNYTVMSRVSVSSFQLCHLASLTIPHYNYYLAQQVSENQVQILCSFISTFTGSVLKYFLSNFQQLILLGYGGLSNNADTIKNITFCGLRTGYTFILRRTKQEPTSHFQGLQYMFQLLCWLLRNVSLVYATESSGGNSSMAG